MTTVVSGDLVLADRVVPGRVAVEDGLIVDVRGGPGGPIVVPGLVDLHAHGADGRTFNDPSADAWSAILRSHRRQGTTSVLATVATARWPEVVDAITVAGGLGQPVHVEGPYLAVEHRGAHPEGLLAAPSDGHWRDLVDHDVVRVVTMAPELDGAATAAADLAAAGITVAAGHTASTALPPAVRHVTHLWSGHTLLRKEGPWRRLGLLETVLADDDLTAEVIADGFHVPAELLRIAYRCLGPDRLCLVSDASAGTGLPVGSTFAMGGVAGVVADGVALSRDGTAFCGSTSFLSDVLRYALREARLPLVDAVRMATATPARVGGLPGGRIVPGAPADLVVLGPDLAPRRVMARGRWLDEVVAR